MQQKATGNRNERSGPAQLYGQVNTFDKAVTKISQKII